MDGKQTTVTISKEIAQECERRIANYKTLRKIIGKMLADALKSAPWTEGEKT